MKDKIKSFLIHHWDKLVWPLACYGLGCLIRDLYVKYFI